MIKYKKGTSEINGPMWEIEYCGVWYSLAELAGLPDCEMSLPNLRQRFSTHVLTNTGKFSTVADLMARKKRERVTGPIIAKAQKIIDNARVSKHEAKIEMSKILNNDSLFFASGAGVRIKELQTIIHGDV